MLASSQGHAYSVLSHEAIIDSAWDHICALLLQRSPGATPDELRMAHAYAYGGSLVQDQTRSAGSVLKLVARAVVY